MSNLAIGLGTLVVGGFAAAAWVVLLGRYGGSAPAVELDAVRTAGALVVATGGAVALLLAARRQRVTELTLVHTEHDATERRFAELYSKAADQLGSDQAPVRLAGLYALERLALTDEHRQIIINVICAYLRMPFVPFGDKAPTEDALPEAHSRHEHCRQEAQVRRTAQDILTRGLLNSQPTPPVRSSRQGRSDRVDLSGALLIDFDLQHCQIGDADFQGAHFHGDALFNCTQFNGTANFSSADFIDSVMFNSARFADDAEFNGARFRGTGGQFECAEFYRAADFTDARLSRTGFARVRFAGWTLFTDAQFEGDASFNRTDFIGPTDFEHARFTPAHFHGFLIPGTVDCSDARTTPTNAVISVWPTGWVTRPAMADEDPNFRYLVPEED